MAKKQMTDEQLLAELDDDGSGVSFKAVPMSVSVSRLDACVKCESRLELVCTLIRPKEMSRLNVASAVKRDDVECPLGKWTA